MLFKHCSKRATTKYSIPSFEIFEKINGFFPIFFSIVSDNFFFSIFLSEVTLSDNSKFLSFKIFNILEFNSLLEDISFFSPPDCPISFNINLSLAVVEIESFLPLVELVDEDLLVDLLLDLEPGPATQSQGRPEPSQARPEPTRGSQGQPGAAKGSQGKPKGAKSEPKGDQSAHKIDLQP